VFEKPNSMMPVMLGQSSVLLLERGSILLNQFLDGKVRS
jgi:hypothetical protein